MVKTTAPAIGRGKEYAHAVAMKSVWRHKGGKKKQSAINGITKPAIRRLARRGGVQRIQGEVYPEIRSALRSFLEPVISDAITYSQYAKRKTVMVVDVLHALKRNGRTVYGFHN
jgi:histone H4